MFVHHNLSDDGKINIYTLYDDKPGDLGTFSNEDDLLRGCERQKANYKREKEIENLKNKKRHDLYNGFYYYSFNDENGKEIHALFGHPSGKYATARYLGEYYNLDDLMKYYERLNKEIDYKIEKKILKELEDKRRYYLSIPFYYYAYKNENGDIVYYLFGPESSFLGGYKTMDDLMKEYKYQEEKYRKIKYGTNKKIGKEETNKSESKLFKFSDNYSYITTEDENGTKTYVLFDPYGNILGNYSNMRELSKGYCKFKKDLKNKKSNTEIQNRSEKQNEMIIIKILKLPNGGFCTCAKNKKNERMTYGFYNPYGKFLGNYSNPFKKHLELTEIYKEYENLSPPKTIDKMPSYELDCSSDDIAFYV